MPKIKEINVDDLARMLRNDNHFDLLDVRTRIELERGVLPNAKALAMHLIPLQLQLFAESPRQIVIYCRTGSRSAKVCRFLNKHGINNVFSLRGGIVRWIAAGHPMDREPSEIIG